MNGSNELKIIMVAPRRIGKTSLLAAMHEEFYKTFEQANIQTWTDDNVSLRAVEECKKTLKNIDCRLKNNVTPTQPKDNPWSDKGFIFEIGSNGQKFMKLKFTDPSGEYFNSTATQEQKEYVKHQLNDCDAIVIPIDATALMQTKLGKVKDQEIGTWHEEKNNPQRITQLIKDAFSNNQVTSPRLIILAPVKSESYMNARSGQGANELLNHVKMGYSELLDFCKSDSLLNKVSIVITPVQTIGNIAFAYHKEDESGLTQFYYYKTPITAVYSPKDGDQPLRYILLFLINVYLEEKKILLQQEQAKLDALKDKLQEKSEELEQAKREFEIKKRKLDDRNKTWWGFRHIANFFDDRETPFYNAKGEFESTKKVEQEVKKDVDYSQLQVKATEEQIKAFNNALFKFSVGCKNSDGFAVLQGHKYLEIPMSLF
jgi:DNA-binding transcriptional MerR regulator